MALSQWKSRHAELYNRATTHHPYIVSIRNGSVDLSCYKRWLGQDYIFVKAFVRFIGSILAKIPSNASDETLMTLLSGASALHDELQWFQKEALVWKIGLEDLPPKKTTQDYCRFLEDMSQPSVDYAVVLSTFWAIEHVYFESFAFCLEPGSKTPHQLVEACGRWGSPSFGSYCDLLRSIAEAAVESTGSNEVKQRGEDAFVRVLQLENEFWNMSTDVSQE
ncbi:hypothetical protein SELMODRAFT_92107 [Selaginella moellendorffii]|uniref:Thiaminase-2/PQQC domain-containing protein n=1 Tax=Selaginella moellendorffii TaxID=88036 RepID=D8RFJ3_SELML|nr:bifunctional TENA2 protein [Selaginella moellendorffii]EFJ29131.1 hypothetical protein SELMODRAFT_92107 [Selaginella moellendorffii]|eukprot:XP_002970007.1 bifunctional TENA2 protein [Selaginella moellendorffii]